MSGISRITDRGAKALLNYGQRLSKGAAFTVGIHDKQGAKPHGESDQTIGAIATRHEYGLGVPRRSFLRDWMDENADMVAEDFRQATKAVFAGKMSYEKAANILGVKYVALIQKRIVDGLNPANAPSTIAAKGSSTPLIDTGVLKASIKYALQSIGARADAAAVIKSFGEDD